MVLHPPTCPLNHLLQLQNLSLDALDLLLPLPFVPPILHPDPHDLTHRKHKKQTVKYYIIKIFDALGEGCFSRQFHECASFIIEDSFESMPQATKHD